MKRQQLPGFTYDRKRKRAVFDGFVPGTKCKVRRQRTIDNVTEKEARAAWERFRDDLASGRAIQGPLTLRQCYRALTVTPEGGYRLRPGRTKFDLTDEFRDRGRWIQCPICFQQAHRRLTCPRPGLVSAC